MRVSKLLVLVICFFLYSAITIFLYSQDRKPSSEITKNEEEDRVEVIINENDYFFARPAGQEIENVIFFINVGILLFIWENSKSNNKPKYKGCCEGNHDKNCCCFNCCENCYDNYNEILNRLCCSSDSDGSGVCERQNWFGFATFVSFIVITLFVEFVLNPFLIGSFTHLFINKNKNKRYFHTLKMSWKKIFLPWEKKIHSEEFVFNYIGFAFIIILIAKLTSRCWVIIKNHHANLCCCFCTPKGVLLSD